MRRSIFSLGVLIFMGFFSAAYLAADDLQKKVDELDSPDVMLKKAKAGESASGPDILDSSRSATGRRYSQSQVGLMHLLFDKNGFYDKTGLFVIGRHTQVYQLNLTSGGVFAHRHAGRWQGVYDVDFDWNLGPMLKLPNTRLHMTVSGRWSNGLNATSVGAFTNVSAFGSYDGDGNNPIYVSQYFVDQTLFDGALLVRAGKYSLGNFDRNFFAEDASRQFMNVALVSNPTIPFPEAGLGVMANWRINSNFYVMASVNDSNAHRTETGFNTAFHSPSGAFTIVEGGFENIFIGDKALPTAVRLGFWHDSQSKGTWNDGAYTLKQRESDCGFYFNLAQMLYKENDDLLDMQGLGMFFRYGYRGGDIAWFDNYWSIGAQYQGLIPGRDDDTLGFGVAQVLFDNEVGLQTSEETAYELYYNVPVTPFFNVGASVQYISNPGGVRDVNESLVTSFRASLTF